MRYVLKKGWQKKEKTYTWGARANAHARPLITRTVIDKEDPTGHGDPDKTAAWFMCECGENYAKEKQHAWLKHIAQCDDHKKSRFLTYTNLKPDFDPVAIR